MGIRINCTEQPIIRRISQSALGTNIDCRCDCRVNAIECTDSFLCYPRNHLRLCLYMGIFKCTGIVQSRNFAIPIISKCNHSNKFLCTIGSMCWLHKLHYG